MFVLLRSSLCVLSIGGIVAAMPPPALAQTEPGASPATHAEVAALREELRQLRAEVARLAQTAAAPAPATTPMATPVTGPAAGAEATPDLAAAVTMLQSQVAEQAQTKVESASRLPVKLTGTIVMNSVFNSGEANWLENPNLTTPVTPAVTGSHSATLRQSRIGVSVDGPTLGAFRTSGLLALDFFGGTPPFPTGPLMGLPRLLYGLVRLEGDRTSFEVGQDHAILAPRNPTSLAAQSFPLLFRSGNLYLRTPQARVEQRLGHKTTLTAGVVVAGGRRLRRGLYVCATRAGR